MDQPGPRPYVKDAEAALAAGHVTSEELDEARRQGDEIIRGVAHWPSPTGDWRSFIPPAHWVSWQCHRTGHPESAIHCA
jgi:hypothetical protein